MMSPQQTDYPKTLAFSAVDSSFKATIRRHLKQNALAVTNLFVDAVFADFTRPFLFHNDNTYRNKHAEQKDQKKPHYTCCKIKLANTALVDT